MGKASKAKDGEKSVLEKINKNKESILTDNKNANLLLDILKLTQSDSTEVVVGCCKALGDIFGHFLSSYQFLDTSKIAVAEEDLSKEDQFNSWLKDQFSMSCDVLCGHLLHQRHSVQVSSIESLVTILHAGSNQVSQSASGDLMESVLSKLLSEEQDQSALLSVLPTTLSDHGGGGEAVITQTCLSQLKKTLKHIANIPTEIFLKNCWQLIKNLATQDLDDKSKRLLTAVVCDFLKLKLPTSLYRDILPGLSSIMEKMSSPIRLADFLSESFNMGGAISLLSLHGLFILMHKYNLDYPDFYKKLYAMFEPQVFSAKYRARFFHLAQTFLSSTHLPAYLVAAFAKRLARLSLHAPTPGAHLAVPLILNLIHGHPACEVLLHKEGPVTDLTSDPYLPDQEDPSECHALDSCLWELESLSQHYDPSLSQQAKKRTVMERNLASVLDNSFSDLVNSEAKKIKSEVAVTFVKPSGLELPPGFSL